MSDTIFVLNGPNLNLLGQRRPEVYGYTTLHDIERSVRERAAAHGFDVEFMQSNHEGVLVDEIQRARTRGAAIIINPAGVHAYLRGASRRSGGGGASGG